MGVELKLYEKLELTTDVKPGQILEAQPGAFATAVYFRSEPETDSPTNVFGYIRGNLERNYLDGFYQQSTTLVERLIPSGREYVNAVRDLAAWAPDGKQVYLVVGELTDISTATGSDRFTELFEEGSVTLSEDQAGEIKRALLAFSRKRDSREYVFEASDGKEYSLNDIVLSLRER